MDIQFCLPIEKPRLEKVTANPKSTARIIGGASTN
jgi:hypothetical protein